ncbi:HNH endonuclease [Streptomyces sp. NPDC003027]
MAEGRPDIPMELRRAVLVEAGHRCAIQTCRQTPVDLAHITPWAKVRAHTFDNLIALCPTCHRRFDRGDIDRKAMLQYKANLDVLNHRYTDLERQLLRMFVRRRQIREGNQKVPHKWPEYNGWSRDGLWPVEIDKSMWWAVSNILEDGLIVLGEPGAWPTTPRTENPRLSVALTPKGGRLIGRIANGEPL